MTTPEVFSPPAGASVPRGRSDPLRRFRFFLRGVAILSGFFSFWSARYVMFPDGISYLDIADLYVRGAWKAAVSEYWSPLLSWLLAAALSVIRPAPRFEAVLFHAILFAGYCAALAAFEYFLRQFLRVFDARALPGPERVTLRRALLVAAYAAFIWGTIGLVGPCTPDVLVAALVYLLSGMLLRCAHRRVGLAFCAAFGAVLGICWLTKSALLFTGLTTLPAFVLLVRKWRKPLVPLLCLLAALAMVCFPYLAAVRAVKGHWTLGKTGLLNYSWEVGEVDRYFHWQGGPEGYGKPLHPTRQVMTSPPVYAFSTAAPVTYAPWFDPAYWYEGVRARFDAQRQIRAFGVNFTIALGLLLATPGVAPALLVWCWKRGKLAGLRVWWRMTGAVWVWCGVTILLYSVVFVEPRYLTGTLAVMSCLLLAPALSAAPPLLIRGNRWFNATSVLTCIQAFWRPVFFGFAFLLFELGGLEPNPNVDWREAEYLQSKGMRAGDRVAVIGYGAGAYWARLIQARVVAEIPLRATRNFDLIHSFRQDIAGINTFWNAPPQRQQEVLVAFARAGARWVVAEPVPTGIKAPDGWTELPFTKKTDEAFNGVARTFVRRLEP